ncbi:Pre-mRNA-splicing factor [Hanseniaspora osmophila]|uniref:Pre-mRNA-splicing factor n=1 Tax=Hanseniaspora osmophila TaxID=56408 RepID=A0A1E5RI13_9ASCO|nr:Pre-mRNA-splicing factor [Hanseniaspora osmophila]
MMVALQELHDKTVPSSIASPELRSVKDSILKTALYVINNGKSFESKIITSEQNNKNFSFLHEGDIYHEYYKFLIDSYVQENSHTNSTDTNVFKNAPVGDPLDHLFLLYKNFHVSPKDLKVIKLTALACSLYDYHSTYENMKLRYAENPQFDFLEPEHSLYPVFANLVNQYTLVLSSEKDKGNTILTQDTNDPLWQQAFLERCYLKGAYNEFLEEKSVNDLQQLKVMKLRYNAIDWYNFKIMHKFDFAQPSDEKPKPALSFSDLKKNTLLTSQSELLSQYFDLKSQESIKETYRKRKSKKRNMVIKAAGESRMSEQKRRLDLTSNIVTNIHTSGMIQCPITAQMVKESDFDNHIRLLLQDPNYASEKRRFKEDNQLSNLTDHQVYENIKKITSKR